MNVIKLLLNIVGASFLLWVLNELVKMAYPNWGHTFAYSCFSFFPGFALVVFVFVFCFAIFVTIWPSSKNETGKRRTSAELDWHERMMGKPKKLKSLGGKR
jgi:ABC-type lipoprotein release transport system permease subunit